jgi:L-ribulose-5-phosphate 4-epimerase
MADYAELRERVSAANLALVRAGLVTLTFGNASGVDRSNGVLAIKPSGVSYEELRPDAIVVVDLATGEVVAGEGRPSSDTPTHAVLYDRFDGVEGIVHTHSPAATAWAQAQREIPCFGTTHADHFRGSVPVTRPLTPEELAGDYEAQTGEAIVETFVRSKLDPLEIPGVLVASHGPFAWGPDVEDAVENAVALEVVADLALRTLALNAQATPVSEHLLDRHFSRKHGPAAYYGQPR